MDSTTTDVYNEEYSDVQPETSLYVPFLLFRQSTSLFLVINTSTLKDQHHLSKPWAPCCIGEKPYFIR